jgi:hypothetical protein
MIEKLSRYRVMQFRELWNRRASEYEFYSLARKIDNRLTFAKFDYGWQYCTVKNDIFKVAIQEFLIAINECF